MEYPDFILFGRGNYNSLGVLHAMASAGKNVLILNIGEAKKRREGNIIGFSKHAKNIVCVGDVESGINWLLENQNNFADDTIIYPTGDEEEKALDSNPKLRDKFIFPSCREVGGVVRLMDKERQIHLAQESGLRILESQYSNSPSFDFEKIKYPCMVKPIDSTRGCKGDMRVCHTEAQLREALSSGRNTKDFIVQQYIRNEEDRLFLGVALKSGEVLIPALVRKPGVSPTGEYTHAIVTTEADRYLPEKKQVIAFIKSLGYKGPFSIEFGHEAGKNYFFEINLRNDGTSHYPLNAGVNLPLIYYNDARGLPVADGWEEKEYEMIDEVGDLRRVISREIGIKEWWKSFRNAGSYRFYYRGDRGLLRALVPMFFSRSLSKLTRRVAPKWLGVRG